MSVDVSTGKWTKWLTLTNDIEGFLNTVYTVVAKVDEVSGFCVVSLLWLQNTARDVVCCLQFHAWLFDLANKWNVIPKNYPGNQPDVSTVQPWLGIETLLLLFALVSCSYAWLVLAGANLACACTFSTNPAKSTSKYWVLLCVFP